MVLLFPSSPYYHSQVSSFTVFHDDVDSLVSFVYYPIVVLYNVRMDKLPQYIHFRDQLLLFFLAHFAIVKFFPNKCLAVCLSSDLADLAKRAYKIRLVGV